MDVDIRKATHYWNFKKRARHTNTSSRQINRKLPRSSHTMKTSRWSCTKTDKFNYCSNEIPFREATCGFRRRDVVNHELNSGVRETPSLRLHAVWYQLAFILFPASVHRRGRVFHKPRQDWMSSWELPSEAPDEISQIFSHSIFHILHNALPTRCSASRSRHSPQS